jgi:hypothetical protein
LSTIAGSSSSLKACSGLPAFADSSSAISSPCSSIASASLSSAVERSAGVVRPHVSNAVRAAFTARSTSSAVESGACAISSPVAGLRTADVRPSAGSTNSPSTKFLSVSVAVAMASASLGVGLAGT